MSGGVTASTVHEIVSPKRAIAYDASTGDYPWADAAHVGEAPDGPAQDNITWGYTDKGICDDKSADYDCRSYKVGSYHTRDQWGYDVRNCTSYVAWRLAKEYGVDASGMENATKWDNHAAVDKHWSVDTTPEVGDVAQFEGDDNNQFGSPGHVAFVTELGTGINSGKVKIAEYNQGLDGKFRSDRWVVATRYIDVNGENAPTPPLDPDTDKDGVKDSQDHCPTKPGFAASNGCSVKADYNHDGRADVVGFYRYDSNVVGMRGWWGQTSGFMTDPTGPWTGNGWDGSRIIPAGRGDFNDDGKEDAAAFFRHDGSMIDLNIWYGDGVGNFTPLRAWHVPSGWDGSRLIPVGSGDINGDGRADIVAFYRHDNNLTDLRIWYGQSSGYTTEPTGPWGGAGWDGSRIIPGGVGDLDGDGKLDISTFYRHDNGMVDHNVWYGNGVGDFTLARPWHVETGWDASRFIPAGVADFNSDGKADTAVFFRHDNSLVDLRIWYGTSNRFMGEPGGPWSASGWEGQRIIPAGSGDYNGDGKADIATFYNHTGGMLDMNIWYGDGHGNLALFRAWHVDAGWEGDRVIPAKG